MSIKTKALLAAIAACLYGPTVAAQDSVFNNRLYIGAGAGVSQLEPNTDKVNGVEVTEDSDTAAKVFVGYDLNPNFAVEGYYNALGEAQLTPNAGGERSIGYNEAGVSALFYGYNPGGYQALADREGLSLFAKAGVGMLDNEDRTNVSDDEHEQLNDVNLTLGVGGEFGMANGFAVRGEYESFDKDAKAATVSVLKRFGEAAQPIMDEPAPPPAPEPPPPPPPVEYVPPPVEYVPPPPPPVVYEEVTQEVVDDFMAEVGGLLPGITFELDKATLTPESRFILDNVAMTLQKYPQIDVEVQAHTDNWASDEYNIDLSNRRAATVVRYLVDAGIDRSRMKPVGYGESQPAYRNDTAEGRRKNRRVEFRVLNY